MSPERPALQAVFDLLVRFHNAGMVPTYRDISANLERSISTCHHHVNVLRSVGLVELKTFKPLAPHIDWRLLPDSKSRVRKPRIYKIAFQSAVLEGLNRAIIDLPPDSSVTEDLLQLRNFVAGVKL